jgi:DNA-binding transcriptional LysR family regulator
VRVSTLEAVANFMLVPSLPSLLARHPGIQVELLPDSVVADLQARESDIALRLVPPGDGEIIAKAIDAGPLRAYTAAQGGRRKAPLAPADVNWIGWDSGRSFQPEQRWMSAHRVPVVLRSSRATTMIQAAIAGIGAVLLPERFGDRVAGLARIEVDRLPAGAITLWLAMPRGLRHEPVVEQVWAWLIELFDGSPRRRPPAPRRNASR